MGAVKRVKTALEPEAKKNVYFPPRRNLEFIPSGCTVLDCVLGGGWPLGRIANIVGDKSTGKTLLAIEACANFDRLFPKGKIFYRESEAAFDADYAEDLGLPTKRIDFGPEGLDTKWDTVEDIFEDMEKQLAACEQSGTPGLYIIDSLDALSTRAEAKLKIDQGTYGTEKAKLIGRLFRQLVRKFKAQKFCIIIVSQIRDRIGVTYGEKKQRTGGHAMDFYCSNVIWLHHVGYLKATRKGVERVTGVQIKVLCKKNKIAPPRRECEMTIRFGYGVEDVEASVDWLHQVKLQERIGIKSDKDEDAFFLKMRKLEGKELRAAEDELRSTVIATWQEVEGRFKPTRKKYAADSAA